MADLLSISPTLAAERQLDVVFVHGLGGDPLTTWRHGNDASSSWPHWLAEAFPESVGVWSLGYAASPTKLRGVGASIGQLFGKPADPDEGQGMSLTRRAENCLDRLVKSGIGQRPCLFIAHSLGGLLVKAILRKAAESIHAPERQAVLSSCRGVLFLATPHQGSSLATLASKFKLYFPTVTTEDLQDNDDHLIDLYEWYRANAPERNIQTRSYYEDRQTANVVTVVSRTSADPGVSGITARGPTPLDKDHIQISKPLDRTDQAYLESVAMIGNLLDGRAEPAPYRFNPASSQRVGSDRSSSSTSSLPSASSLPIVGSYGMVANVRGDHNTVVGGQGNQVLSGVTAGGDVVLGDKVGGDMVAGDKFDGDKVAGDKIVNQPSPTGSAPGWAPPPAGTAAAPSLKPGPWRVFLSHTSELRQYPAAASYIDKAERAVSAEEHVIVDMADFPSIDEAPATVCIERVQGCDVYVGIFGTRYGSPVRDRPEVSYTELEFDTATAVGIPRLVFLLDTEADELGIPAKALIDREYGSRQDDFLQRVKDSGMTMQRFRNPDDLKALVERSLRALAEKAQTV